MLMYGNGPTYSNIGVSHNIALQIGTSEVIGPVFSHCEGKKKPSLGNEQWLGHTIHSNRKGLKVVTTNADHFVGKCDDMAILICSDDPELILGAKVILKAQRLLLAPTIMSVWVYSVYPLPTICNAPQKQP